MPVIWRARALADVVRIVRYVAADNPIAAARIGRELLLAGDSLVMFPALAAEDASPELANWLPCVPISLSTGSSAPTR